MESHRPEPEENWQNRQFDERQMDDNKIKCSVCGGDGWYADHSLEHYHNSQDCDCSKYGCPVQVECEICEGTGYIVNKKQPAKPMTS